MGDAQFSEEGGEENRVRAGKSAWIDFVSLVGDLINLCFHI